MATLAFQNVGRTMLLAHAAEPPSDTEWNAYVEALVSHGVQGLIVWTDGGGPNAGQRKRLMDRPGLPKLRTAVLTTSIVARGIATAIGWTDEPVRAFAPDDLDAAIAFVGIEHRREEVLRAGLTLRLRVLGSPAAVAAGLPLDEVARLLAGTAARLEVFARAAART